jgi:hypothetical protein
MVSLFIAQIAYSVSKNFLQLTSNLGETVYNPEAQKHASNIENNKLFEFAITDTKQGKCAETQVALMRSG